MMIRNTRRKFLATSLITSIGIASVYAESFRVSKLHTAPLKAETNSEVIVRPGINDSVAVFLPEDKTFLEGVELKMDIPEVIATWMDSVACSVYDMVKPLPSASIIDYSGSRQYVKTLPNKLSWILQIPLTSDNSMKASNYITKMDCIPAFNDNVIFVRLQPVMKGIPEETQKAKVPITVKPIFSNKGQLTINLSGNTDENHCSVFIDDQPVSFFTKNDKILLDTGIHNVSIISEEFRTEVRTVRIDQAKVTELNVELKSIEPTLLITAPEGTAVIFDDEPCSTINQEFVISEGEHKIKFSIGNYEIIRSITAVKGRTYTANFTLDLDISEH